MIDEENVPGGEDGAPRGHPEELALDPDWLIHAHRKTARMAFIADIASIARGAAIADAAVDTEAAQGVVQEVAQKPASKPPRGPGAAVQNAAHAIGMFWHIRGLPVDIDADVLADQVKRYAVKRGFDCAGDLDLRTLSVVIGCMQNGIRWADQAEPD